MTRWNRWAAVWIGMLVSSLFLTMMVLPLGWGTMDDTACLTALRGRWVGLSVLTVLRAESTWLWFRPIYTLWVYYAYGLFINHPRLFYLANLLLVITSVTPWILLIHRQIPEAWKTIGARLFTFLLLAALPLYNIVIYLSLQEKFVLLFGGLAMLLLDFALTHPRDGTFRWWSFSIGSLFFFILGLWSKPTTLFLAPAALLYLLLAPGLSSRRRIPNLVLWSGLALKMTRSFLKRRDSYSAHYSTDPGQLFHLMFHQPLAVYGFGTLALLCLVILMMHRDSFYRWLLWPVTTLTYLAILMPWGIRTYLWAPAMVGIAGCLVFLIGLTGFLDRKVRAGTTLAIAAAAATFVVAFIGVGRLRRQAETTMVVHWLRTSLPNPAVHVYVMAPCEEAAHALEYLSGSTQSFDYLQWNEEPTLTSPHAWLITRDECPIDPGHEAFFNRIIFRLPHWTIYETS